MTSIRGNTALCTTESGNAAAISTLSECDVLGPTPQLAKSGVEGPLVGQHMFPRDTRIEKITGRQLPRNQFTLRLDDSSTAARSPAPQVGSVGAR